MVGQTPSRQSFMVVPLRFENLVRALATQTSRRTTLGPALAIVLSLMPPRPGRQVVAKGKHGKGKKGKGSKDKHHCAGASAQGNTKGDCPNCATNADCPLNAICLLPQGACILGCVDSNDCDATRYCDRGLCYPITPDPVSCDRDSECPPGQYCNNDFECYTP